MKPSPVEERYAEQVGSDALARQKAEAERGRCDYCWALPGDLHVALCPNRPDEQEGDPPAQSEGLF